MRYLEHVILEISVAFLPDLAAINPEEKLKKVPNILLIGTDLCLFTLSCFFT